MNWYKTILASKEVEIPPEEVGYDPSWGEHHGPVKTERNMWSYGHPGYNTGSPPMPLPKILYHVSPNADKILQEGFKTFRSPSEQTFGGHGSYSSFTSLSNARLYRASLQDAIKISKLDTSKGVDYLKKELSCFMNKWKIRDSWFESLESELAGDRKYNEGLSEEQILRKVLFHIIGTAHIYSDAGFPYFCDSSSTCQRLSSMSPEQVKIVKVEVMPNKWHSGTNIFDDTSMDGNYTFNKGENEWRIWNTKTVKPVGIVE